MRKLNNGMTFEARHGSETLGPHEIWVNGICVLTMSASFLSKEALEETWYTYYNSEEGLKILSGVDFSPKKISARDVVDYLNELLGLDLVAISSLIETRVLCNKLLADHPTVQVVPNETGNVVGLLGILNGLFGVKKDFTGYIGAQMEGNTVIKFEYIEKK